MDALYRSWRNLSSAAPVGQGDRPASRNIEPSKALWATLIEQGRFKTIKIAGNTFLLRSEVEKYQPGLGGRPKKTKSDRKKATPTTKA